MRRQLFKTLLCLGGLTYGDLQLEAQTTLQSYRMAVILEAETGTLRPILGFPGGAYVGPPLESALEQAVLSPDGTFAVGGSPGEYFLYALQGSSTDSANVKIPLNTTRNPVWSTDSKALALLNEDGSQIFIYERTASKEGWTGPRNISLIEPAERILALDAQRNQVWFRITRKSEEVSSSDLFVTSWDSQDTSQTHFSLAGSFRDPVSMLLPLVDSTGSWVVADRGTNRIYRLQKQETGWIPEEVFAWGTERSGLEVVGVANSSTGTWFSVWKGSEAFVCWHETDGRCVEELALDTQPKDLDILPGSKFFSFTRKFPSREALSILDPAQRKAYFIPWGDEAK